MTALTSSLMNPSSVPQQEAPSDFDPAEEVCKSLLFAGHKDPHRWLHGIDPNAVNPDAPTHLRRFLVNRHLRLVLGMADEVNTTVARYCLVDQGSDKEWAMLIRENIAPCIAKHDLPALQKDQQH